MEAGGDDGAGPGEQSCPGDEDERTRREGGTRPSSRSSGTRSGVDPRQIAVRRLVAGAVVAGIVWQALLAAGGYLVVLS